jgi:hypothetical protein
LYISCSSWIANRIASSFSRALSRWRGGLLAIAAVLPFAAHADVRLAVIATSGAVDGQSVADSAARGNTEKYAVPQPGDLVRFCPNATCDWSPAMVWRKFGSLAPTDKLDVCTTQGVPAGTAVPRPWTSAGDPCKSWAAVAKAVAYPSKKFAIIATSGAVDGQSVATSAARGNTEKYDNPRAGDLVRFCPNATCDWGPGMVWRRFETLAITDKIDACTTAGVVAGTAAPRPWSSAADSCKSWAATMKAEFVTGTPTISGTAATAAVVGTSYSFQPTAVDPDGDTLTFSASGKPSWASFSATTGRLSGTPDVATSWSNIVITVSDGKSSTSLPAFSIKAVAPPNAAPTIGGAPSTSVVALQPYTFKPSATDTNGDTLTFSISNRPAWAAFNAATGQLSGTPATTNVAVYANIVIGVSDGKASTYLPAFSVTVQAPPNRAPTISGSSATSIVAGDAYSFRPVASDADGDALGFSIQNRPVWATFSTVTGTLAGTPTSAQAGTYGGIVISVSDGKATVPLPALTLTVTAPNVAPTIAGSPATAAMAGTTYRFRPTASDANGDMLNFSIANLPTWATFNSATGELSGTPSAADAGSYGNVLVSVSDGKATASLPAFAIKVSQVDLGVATLSWTPPTQNIDGSPLTDLAGYRIVYGTSATALNQSIQIANPTAQTYTIKGLSPLAYYFAVKSYNSAGAESVLTPVLSKDFSPATGSLAIACDKPGQLSGTPVADCQGFEVYRKPASTDLVRSCMDGQPASCYWDASYSHRRLSEIADSTFVEVCDTQITNGTPIPSPWTASGDLCKSWRVIPKWQLVQQ